MSENAKPYYATSEGEGGISAKVVAYSVNQQGKAIITWQLRYPRLIHGELMTHRLFSRNAGSSRAIPVKKMIAQVRHDPAMPIHWGQNQPGMQAKGELSGMKRKMVRGSWRVAAKLAAGVASVMNYCGAHKQIANRILEPFQFMHTLVTATELENFFQLRIHKEAQPEIQELASLMRFAQAHSTPKFLNPGEWHLPYVREDELKRIGIETALKCSAARCARVSYLNHDNSKPSVESDLALYNMLAVRPFDDGKGHVLGESDPVHLSPLEHQATPMHWSRQHMDGPADHGTTAKDMEGNYWSGNFKGWIQYRQYEFSN